MNVEKTNQIRNLISVYRPTENSSFQDARFLGMAIAMLTNEQADEMISYLEKWISEEK